MRGERRLHTIYLPRRLFMLADGHLCCTHIALREHSTLAKPLLSPWPQCCRVMANTLRIKCILSPSLYVLRWHHSCTVLNIRLSIRTARSSKPSHYFFPPIKKPTPWRHSYSLESPFSIRKLHFLNKAWAPVRLARKCSWFHFGLAKNPASNVQKMGLSLNL